MAKVGSKGTAVRRQLNRLPVAGKTMKRVLPKPASSRSASLDGVYTIRPAKASLPRTWQLVPVIGSNRKPLMPTTPWRAEKWIRSGKATPFWSKGIFCVRLNRPLGNVVQPIACGIDPGSKKEGFTVKSEAHTFLNINADAVTWVKDAVEQRRMMRHARRQRKTPCRQPRFHRAESKNFIAPSTKARWQWKLRLASWLSRFYPISQFVVEDIKAKSKSKPRWDKSFSPLEVGKTWFYSELGKLAPVQTKQGYETKELRDNLGLKKSKSKMAEIFEAHCIDSWVLANWWTGGHIKPDYTKLLCITPLRFHRRQLHMLQPAKGGVRKIYGGTRSLGFKRGSLVKHKKHGIFYIGGTVKDRISFHALRNGKRLYKNIRPPECKFLTFLNWRTENK